MNKKYISGAIVVIVVLVMILGFSNLSAPQQTRTEPTMDTVGQTPAVANQQAVATGNIDDTTAVVLKDTDSDTPPAAETDSSTVSENDSAINDFGQTVGTGANN